MYSSTLMGRLPPYRTSYLLTLAITTRRAGRFTPAASVGVEETSLMACVRNPDSTASRQLWLSPAWWKAAPAAPARPGA